MSNATADITGDMLRRLATISPIRREGRVVQGIGLTIEAQGLELEIGRASCRERV